MLCHNALSHPSGIFFISHQHKKSEFVQKGILRVRDHIYILFIPAYSYNCSILLLVIVNLLLCLTGKLNFTVSMYIQEKTVNTGLDTPYS